MSGSSRSSAAGAGKKRKRPSTEEKKSDGNESKAKKCFLCGATEDLTHSGYVDFERHVLCRPCNKKPECRMITKTKAQDRFGLNTYDLASLPRVVNKFFDIPTRSSRESTLYQYRDAESACASKYGSIVEYRRLAENDKDKLKGIQAARLKLYKMAIERLSKSVENHVESKTKTAAYKKVAIQKYLKNTSAGASYITPSVTRHVNGKLSEFKLKRTKTIAVIAEECRKANLDNYQTFGMNKSQASAEMYQKGYPHMKYNRGDDKNIQFYRNEIPSKPQGDLITVILKDWAADFDRIKKHHGLIQWLFPIREKGANKEAQMLNPQEIRVFKNDVAIRRRVIKVYKFMLNYYGRKLVNAQTGEIARKVANNVTDKYLKNKHEFMRITRMLKFFGEIGFDRLQAPLCEHFLGEVSQGNLKKVKPSLINFWLPVLRDVTKREELLYRAKHLGDAAGGSAAKKKPAKKRVRTASKKSTSSSSNGTIVKKARTASPTPIAGDVAKSEYDSDSDPNDESHATEDVDEPDRKYHGKAEVLDD